MNDQAAKPADSPPDALQAPDAPSQVSLSERIGDAIDERRQDENHRAEG